MQFLYNIKLARNVSPFHCQYVKNESRIFEMLPFHCKYIKCETNISLIVVFYSSNIIIYRRYLMNIVMILKVFCINAMFAQYKKYTNIHFVTTSNIYQILIG